MIELKINNINFSYGRKRIFSDFSFTATDGITLLLGANGSGKSTLFRLICGALIPKKGTIEVYCNGNKVENKNAIAYIPQNFDIFPSLKVYDVLTYICSERDKTLSKSEIKNQVESAIELTDISEYAYKRVRTLSGGTKQRVGIAQSILGNPQIIVADEPTAGLDPEQRERYNRLVSKTAKGRCFLISTHVFDDTQYYENIALMSDGHINFKGTKEEMVNSVSGKIYQLSCKSDDFKEEMLDGCTILKISENGEETTARFYSETPKKDLGAEPAESDLTDAWLYYCKAAEK
ncbi:MAG: ATP-binding cassette domain-containing protein [Ruminococcaceae bacterium]|nr:ATP-binding cassette domain-containing protein [Oscillospiraceae bacterium]